MSSVTLTSCFSFHPSEKPTEVELKSIHLSEGVRAPEQSLITLYGFRDSLEEISALRNGEEKKGLQFCSVGITVDVGSLPSSLVLSSLKDTTFINLRRISKEIETIVINYFRGYVAQEGGDPKTLETRNYGYLMQRPDLIEKLHQEPEFSHMELFAFPIKLGNQTLQRVAMFGQDNVLTIEAKTYPEVKVTIPKLFKQQKSLSL